MIEFETEVTDVIQRTHNVNPVRSSYSEDSKKTSNGVKSFRFRIREDVGFKPGQFFFVTIRIGEIERTKHFSFSNSPTEKGYVEFTKKITDSEFSQALERLKIGDWARLKMPYGSFVLKDEYNKIAFLSGGIGITPIRSITKYVVDKKLDTDIVLLYGNRTTKDIVFREDFAAMQKGYSGLKVVHILSQAEAGWSGKTGHINAQIIKQEIPDYAERKFYICGPPAMVEAMKRVLQDELAISKENIIIENFSGY